MKKIKSFLKSSNDTESNELTFLHCFVLNSYQILAARKYKYIVEIKLLQNARTLNAKMVEIARNLNTKHIVNVRLVLVAINVNLVIGIKT